MASSSGNSSSGSPPVQSSGSDEDLQNLRKRKRMQSNRESARRSRQRKQKHLDDLTAEVDRLRKDNGRISSSVDLTAQHCARVEAENSVIRAQMMELAQRLESLNEILSYMSSAGGVETAELQGFGEGAWSMVGLNQLQPIVASAEMFDYYC
ncbi:basic leucine-zipper 44 [Striga hermonthica]|uniref:Basic leucine-zipper 44 n=1 Tax=Striga hermonthica TaxID=68872 RepID=A0A9N7P4M0_STRHE|nr:basic leucine-zipper 44 [Striga hermonthica]